MIFISPNGGVYPLYLLYEMTDIFTRLQEMSKTAIESKKQHDDAILALLKDGKAKYDGMEEGDVKTSCRIQVQATAVGTQMVRNDLAEIRGLLVSNVQGQQFTDVTDDNRSCKLGSFELVKAWYFARYVLIQQTEIERYVASQGTRPVSKMRDIDFEQPLTLRWYGETSACKKYSEYLKYLQQNGRFPSEISQAVKEANAKYKASLAK